ncbi:MAG: metallophosphoesterase [Actinobacteria bacterium]|nr:metallophosphoesterase [Actinomycetota bacterium]
MKLLPATLAAGTGLAAYSLAEPYWLKLIERSLVTGHQGPTLTTLHLSDPHLTGSDKRLKSWIGRLPDKLGKVPDLILGTGDFIDNDSGIEPLLEAFAPLDARLGKFYVLGSHDYFQAQFHIRSFKKYFTGDNRVTKAPGADTHRLEEGLQSQGWIPLTNRSETIDTASGTIRLSGVDDPYLKRHRTTHISRSTRDVLAIGLVHAPDVVSEYLLAGFDLVVGGHTHAGQVRVPFFGALVTNCNLPAALAGGLHRVGEGWLHVSPGLGQGRYTPIRFNCRPEATLLKLEPAVPGEDRAWRAR